MKAKTIILKVAERLENEKMKKDIKKLKEEVKTLKSKDKPKTLFEQEWESAKKEAFEGNS